MKKVRKIVCMVFIFSCVIFGVYQVKTKMVEDHKPPVMSLDSKEILVDVDAKDSEITKGVSAMDNKDGDITKSVRVSSMSHFIEKGKRTVEYIVFDKANNAATISRSLRYRNYHSPRIYLKEPLRIPMEQIEKDSFTKNMSAEDCLEGDITNKIRITHDNNMYVDQAGTYKMVAQVSNNAGDVCVVPMEMSLIDSDDMKERERYYPALSDYIVYTKVDKPIKPEKLLVGLQQGNQVMKFQEDSMLHASADDIKIESHVDYSKAGVYPVSFSYTSEDGIQATTKLFVVVEE